MTNLGERLRAEHEHIEDLFDELLNRVHTGDRAVMDEGWRVFEQTLLAHMEFEERRLLVDFAEYHPAEAAWILADHQRIRALLFEVGVELDLHLLTDPRAAALVELIQRHATRESALLYRWASSHRAPGRWHPSSAGPPMA